jgi:peptidyl-prolyl cis-trans isomerase A (cyclophilin A)
VAAVSPSNVTVVSLLAVAGLLAACGSGPTTPAMGPYSSSVSMAASSVPVPEAAPTAGPLMPVAPAASAAAAEAPHHDPATIDPSLATAKAPDVFRARFTTSRGAFVIEVHRDWAPNGADRFYNLVKLGFFDDSRFFRVIEGFMVQFGIAGDPRVSSKWRTANIKDDAVVKSNKRGMVTFAQTAAPDSRSTQLFINFADNANLDASRFAPFGEVVQGMGVVDSLYHGYGEGRPSGQGPDQARVQESGNQYLDAEFPQLDRIVSAQLL